jgi:hypothetical protein
MYCKGDFMNDLKQAEPQPLSVDLDTIRECTELTRGLCIASYAQRHGPDRQKRLAPSVIRVISENLLQRLEGLYAKVND